MNQNAIQSWVDQVTRGLGPAARAGLARHLAQGLRQRQAARIGAQKNPDGSAFDARKPRRPHPGRTRLRGMFAKLRRASHLRATSSTDGLSVGFGGGDAVVARIHQLGLTGVVVRGGPSVKYAERQLLGLSPDDEAFIRSAVQGWVQR